MLYLMTADAFSTPKMDAVVSPNCTIQKLVLFLGICTYPNASRQRIDLIRQLYLTDLPRYPVFYLFGDPPDWSKLPPLPESAVVRPRLPKAATAINTQLPIMMLSFCHYFLDMTTLPWFARIVDDCWVNAPAIPNMLSTLSQYDPYNTNVVFNHWVRGKGKNVAYGQGGSGYIFSRYFVQRHLACFETQWTAIVQRAEDRELAVACYPKDLAKFPSPFHIGHGFHNFADFAKKPKQCPDMKPNRPYSESLTAIVGEVRHLVFVHFRIETSFDLRLATFHYIQKPHANAVFVNRLLNTFVCIRKKS